MLDYKLLEALEAVLGAGSFEKAARRLHLTQSAVSQRIRQLEERSGAVLLVRENPVRATEAGQRLLAHVREVRLLEAELQSRLDQSSRERSGWLPLRIGVNADSLALGLLDDLAPALVSARILLHCVVADEARTLDALRSGEVVGCIGTQPEAIGGCGVMPLGVLEYVLAASPEFCRAYFPQGLNAASLAQAPAAVSGQPDSIHRRWLRDDFGLQAGDYPCHVIPDSTALFGAVRAGMAYGLVPRPQVGEALAKNQVRLLETPGPAQRRLAVALYWHHWARQTAPAVLLAEAVRKFAQRVASME